MMIDDPLGTADAALWKGGCYCESCIAQFREYLKSNFTAGELADKGIVDIGSFNLKEFHAQFSQLPPSRRPLRAECIDFQLKKSAEMFQDVVGHAFKVSGERIPVSCNLNPCYRYAGYLLLKVDYFSCEIPMGAKTGFLKNSQSFLAFKIAEALHKPIAIMGHGGDHAFIQKNNLFGMLRCWIAEAYAFGGYFMTPYWLWAYSPEVGSHRYRPRHKSELTPIYQFVKYHSNFFDEYEFVSHVALILSYKSYRNGSNSIKVLVRKLTDLNVPFQIVIAGDDVLKIDLTESRLKKYDIVITPPDAILKDDDQIALNQFSESGGSIIDGIKDLNLSTRIRFNGAKDVLATLRAVPGNPNKPIMVHLLNRDYDLDTDSCNIKTDFTFKIPIGLLGEQKIEHARYVCPNSWELKKSGFFLRPQKKNPDINLIFQMKQGYIDLKIPELDTWGIVVLSSL